MGQHPTPPRSCGRCEQPAVYRVALIGPTDNPSVMLARRSHYRCTDHLHAGFTPAALEMVARGEGYVVVDAGFTVARSGGLCACGLPADHRYPADGEPRACIDETVRIARVRPQLPPPATFVSEAIPELPSRGEKASVDPQWDPMNLCRRDSCEHPYEHHDRGYQCRSCDCGEYL